MDTKKGPMEGPMQGPKGPMFRLTVSARAREALNPEHRTLYSKRVRRVRCSRSFTYAHTSRLYGTSDPSDPLDPFDPAAIR